MTDYTIFIGLLNEFYKRWIKMCFHEVLRCNLVTWCLKNSKMVSNPILNSCWKIKFLILSLTHCIALTFSWACVYHAYKRKRNANLTNIICFHYVKVNGIISTMHISLLWVTKWSDAIFNQNFLGVSISVAVSHTIGVW